MTTTLATVKNTNDTRYLTDAALAQAIADTCWAAQVDLDGCASGDDVMAAVTEQAPEILDQVLLGHGGNDPTLRRWLACRDVCFSALAEEG